MSRVEKCEKTKIAFNPTTQRLKITGNILNFSFFLSFPLFILHFVSISQ